MGRAIHDLTGITFGHLLVISLISPRDFTDDTGKRHRVTWLCECVCGKKHPVTSGSLVSGRVRSCGCERLKSITRHGLSSTPEYLVWKGIIQRTSNPNSPCFDRYGGRGITIDASWRDFEIFYMEMGSRPSARHTVERIDNEKPYSKANCIWATRQAQANNRSSSVLVLLNGITKSVTQWCRELNVDYKCVKARLERGWSPERSFLTPTRKEFGGAK